MEFTDLLTTSLYHPSSQNVWDSFELSGSQLHHHQLQYSASPHFFEMQTQPFVKLSSCDSAIFQAPPLNATADKPVTSKLEALCSDHLLIDQPATPNSSSISSASSEAVNEEKLAKREDQEEEHKKSDTNKQLKPKKNSLKKEREARVAFMTKSEVDHLEDGYRWRKYGQKAVKNSPFPRSYYRCTTASCNVKKRVERSFRDPSTVVTTYEGQHTHISPLTSPPVSAGGFFGSSSSSSGSVASNLGGAGSFRFPTLVSPHEFQQLVHYHQQQQELLSCFGGVSEYLNNHANGCDESVKKSSGLVKDNGLLQDVVPSRVFKE